MSTAITLTTNKPVIKNYHLTGQQRQFANAILGGMSKIDAYLMYYNPDTPKDRALVKANGILNRGRVAEYLNDKRQMLVDKLVDKGLWERENSVYYLKHIVETNVQAQEKANEALEDEIDFLLHAVEDETDTAKQNKLVKQIISKRQKLKVNRVTNDAVIMAITELNKMHGYNTENMNLFHGQVVFTGANELED